MRRTNRQQKAEMQRWVTAVTALLLGLALFRAWEPLAQTLGGALILVAALRLTALTGRILQEWQRERAAEHAAVQRRARKAARQERNTAAQARRRKERETAINAAARRTEAEETRRQETQARAAIEAACRDERARRIEAEAERLNALPEAEFRAKALLALQKRGLSLVSETTEGTRFAGGEEIALCLPVERMAEKADIEHLERWRAESKARKGWLIARDGFAPDAARLVRSYPALTLADPYLLADWLQSASF